MHDQAITVAGILGVSLILSTVVYVTGRLRIEQQRTLQKLLDSGGRIVDLPDTAGFTRRPDRDLRRGLLLIAIGVLWALVTFFIGGRAWILGVAPTALGLICLLFWKLDGARHGQ